ncbi:MAG TPA: hypothetical protein VFG56_00340, partial [Candidatus Saccharimonadales bacterium]|nr:hypothetical protein [Candidatus Saccharimonadales bacterium]
QATKKTQSTTFTATGKKNVGDKATGTVNFSNSNPSAVTLSAGTELTSSSGLVFLTDSTVTIPGATLDFGCSGYLCPGKASVGVTAAERGSKYNGASGSVSGTPDGVSGSFADATTGGTDETATVVSEDDVEKAKQEIKKDDQEAIRQELAKQFEGDYVIINESFTAKTGDPAVSPAVGEKAETAQLAVETTYTVYAIKRSDLAAIFDAYLKTQMSDPSNQKIYASGDQEVSFSEWDKKDDEFTVRANATGQIGPEIDENQLKQDSEGKMSGEVQQEVGSLSGVQDVKVNLSPFWVSHMPEPDRVTIKFILQDESNQ